MLCFLVYLVHLIAPITTALTNMIQTKQSSTPIILVANILSSELLFSYIFPTSIGSSYDCYVVYGWLAILL